MSDETRPRRPILKLKIAPPPRPAPEPPPKPSRPTWIAPRREVRAEPEAPTPAAPLHDWKCKPCGTSFTPSAELAEEDAVRCPSCNARLGRAVDFRADPPRLEKLRARLVKRA
jgi:hypothetical protein